MYAKRLNAKLLDYIYRSKLLKKKKKYIVAFI